MKSKKRTKRQATPGQSSEELASAAQRHLDDGRFREAISAFKDLLKRAPSARWREGLAAAYAGRAKQLAAKGLLKEALVMWENRQQLGDVASFDPEQIALLLRVGKIGQVMDLYRDQGDRLPAATLAELRSYLAAYWLSGHHEIAAKLPPEDPILVHGDAARDALAAYCQGDDKALSEALAAIPFRSPYRDLAQLLKAIQRIPGQPREAAAMVARCNVSAGFAPLRQAAELALAPEHELTTRLAETGETTRRVALGLRGWDEARQALWLELAKLGQDPNPFALLRLMYRHQKQLGEDWVRQQALRLLINDYPESLRWLAKCGAVGPTMAERGLIAAWHAESKGDLWDALDTWRHYAALLREDGEPASGSDAGLRLALVLRRPESRLGILKRAEEGRSSDELAVEVVAAVGESLRYDPDDRDSYLALIRQYLATKRHKDARRVLEQALERWPEDVRLLTAAMDVAIATNAFKKAAGLARRVLELDPINSGVRERLVAAHLAHARKQIRARRTDLARRELAQAGDWANKETLREQLELTAAFIELTEDQPSGITSLQGLARRLGGGLAGALAVTLEGAALGHKPNVLLKSLGLAATKTKQPSDIQAFFSKLRGHLDAGHKLPPDVAGYFEKPLKASGGVTLSFQEAHSACETLRRAGLDGAREAFAKAALKRWRGAPIFELHAFEATYRGNYRNVSQQALLRLDAAIIRAMDEGDRRTAHRLRDLLMEADEARFGAMIAPPGPSLGEDADSDLEILRALVNVIGLDALLDTMPLSKQEKAQFKEMEREIGRDKLLELIISMKEDALDDDADDPFGDSDPWPPFPFPKAAPGGGKTTPKKKPGKRAAGKKKPPNQLDIF